MHQSDDKAVLGIPQNYLGSKDIKSRTTVMIHCDTNPSSFSLSVTLNCKICFIFHLIHSFHASAPIVCCTVVSTSCFHIYKFQSAPMFSVEPDAVHTDFQEQNI